MSVDCYRSKGIDGLLVPVHDHIPADPAGFEVHRKSLEAKSSLMIIAFDEMILEPVKS